MCIRDRYIPVDLKVSRFGDSVMSLQLEGERYDFRSESRPAVEVRCLVLVSCALLLVSLAQYAYRGEERTPAAPALSIPASDVGVTA